MFTFFVFLKDVPSTTCIGSNHAGGTTRMGDEDCNTEPCPVWVDWRPRSGVKCSAPCGRGTIEETMDCVLADETLVDTCHGKFVRKIQSRSSSS